MYPNIRSYYKVFALLLLATQAAPFDALAGASGREPTACIYKDPHPESADDRYCVEVIDYSTEGGAAIVPYCFNSPEERDDYVDFHGKNPLKCEELQTGDVED